MQKPIVPCSSSANYQWSALCCTYSDFSSSRGSVSLLLSLSHKKVIRHCSPFSFCQLIKRRESCPLRHPGVLVKQHLASSSCVLTTCICMSRVHDPDRSGTISYAEFQQLHVFLTSRMQHFQDLDVNKDGQLAAAEVRQALDQSGIARMARSLPPPLLLFTLPLLCFFALLALL